LPHKKYCRHCPTCYACWNAIERSKMPEQPSPEAMKAAFKALAAMGGRARARKLSKRRQTEIAKLAANARWSAKRSKAKRP
jgi:ABC-type hemin transport system substrate-binding protein